MRREIEKLLGGWAAGTLTDEERRALMEAALEDQALFDQLAAEQPLKEALEDPAIRARVHAAAAEKPRRLFAWRWAWGAGASVAAVSVLTVAVFRSEYGIGVKPKAPAAVLEQSRQPAANAPAGGPAAVPVSGAGAKETAAKLSPAPSEEIAAFTPPPARGKREPFVPGMEQAKAADMRVEPNPLEPPQPARVPAPAAGSSPAGLAETGAREGSSPAAPPEAQRIGQAGVRSDFALAERAADTASQPIVQAGAVQREQAAPPQTIAAGRRDYERRPAEAGGGLERQPPAPEPKARTASEPAAEAGPKEALRRGEADRVAEEASGFAGAAPRASQPPAGFAARQVVSTAAVARSPLRYRVERRDASGRFVPVDAALPLSSSDVTRLVLDAAVPARVTVSAGQTVLWNGTLRPGREQRVALPAGARRVLMTAVPERGGASSAMEVELRYE